MAGRGQNNLKDKIRQRFHDFFQLSTLFYISSLLYFSLCLRRCSSKNQTSEKGRIFVTRWVWLCGLLRLWPLYSLGYEILLILVWIGFSMILNSEINSSSSSRSFKFVPFSWHCNQGFWHFSIIRFSPWGSFYQCCRSNILAVMMPSIASFPWLVVKFQVWSLKFKKKVFH